MTSLRETRTRKTNRRAPSKISYENPRRAALRTRVCRATFMKLTERLSPPSIPFFSLFSTNHWNSVHNGNGDDADFFNASLFIGEQCGGEYQPERRMDNFRVSAVSKT